MVKISHPDMRRGGNLPGVPKQDSGVIVVDNSTQDDDFEQRLAKFQETPETDGAATVAPPSLPVAHKSEEEINKIFKDLILIGRVTKNVELAGHVFEISTLTHRENNRVVSAVADLGNKANYFEIRILALSYALRSVDGVPLSEIPIDMLFDSKEEKCRAIIENLQDGVINKLYMEYDELLRDANTETYKTTIKK